MQLINTNVYDKVTQQRAKGMETSMAERRRQRDMREQAKLNKHFYGMSYQYAVNSADSHPVHTGQRVHEIVIDGIRFHVTDGGSKLIRAPGTWMLSYYPCGRYL